MSFLSTPIDLVGTVSVWDAQLKRATNSFPIYSNVEVYVGRDQRRCNHVVDDPVISNIHLRIYTIIFDRENPDEVAPLVYAQDLSMNGTSWNGYPMGKGKESFLLSDGDVLRLSPKLSLHFRCAVQGKEDCFDMLQMIEMRVFEDQYSVTPQKLGSGAYGQVHMAFKKDTGQQLACKIVDLRALKNKVVREAEDQHSRHFKEDAFPPNRNRLLVTRAFKKSLQRKIQEKLDVYSREARILESLCHPNIISIEKVIESSNTIYLFQELVTAGDLFSYIQYKGGKLDDIEAAVIVRQVLMALDYLHQREIVHRDLKPDNILMTSLADGCRVVLTDFGCARFVRPTVERMSTLIGTFDYSAPEMLKSKQGYTKAVDLWSLGCVAAVLLTGDIPFKNSLTTDPTDLSRERDLEKLEADMEWNKIRQRARDLVRKLLVFDEAKRIDVKQALNHNWFTNPSHRVEFEALYRRAIRGWKPRTHKGSLISNLGSLIKIPEQDSAPMQTLCSDGYSRVDSGQSYAAEEIPYQARDSSTPPVSQEYELCRGHSASMSTTLSDPELPPHCWVGHADTRPPGHPHRNQDRDCFCPDPLEFILQEQSSHMQTFSAGYGMT
ncbi:kinase-like domain-containing protein [Aspergillus caelatus]|uniref:Kinase-like domain-containing protein n=1 Tax=Aspergillus caelatus TaxID=61420 RepID=A0A5N6ZVA6_9EURO|nr:kinase-like domain-containing protein [Aspergillus caelatus]KAE8360200.1 kinase-like domain-containing protein [Aspergillus caelatus]